MKYTKLELVSLFNLVIDSLKFLGIFMEYICW